MTPQLTPREAECVRWAAERKTDAEAARIIGISERTARFHIENARRKHGVATRVQLIVALIRQGLKRKTMEGKHERASRITQDDWRNGRRRPRHLPASNQGGSR